MNMPSLTGNVRSEMWAIARARQAWVLDDMVQSTGASQCYVSAILTEWVRDGVVELRQNCDGVDVYSLAERARKPVVRVERELARDSQARIWHAFRNVPGRTASPRDLAALATTPDMEVSEICAQSYCRLLLKAGYLRVMQKAVPGVRPARYRLIRDTGPRHPRGRRIMTIVDPNTREYAHLPEVPET